MALIKNNNIDASYKFKSLKPKLIDKITTLNKNDTKNIHLSHIPKNSSFSSINEDSFNYKINQKPSFWIEGYGCSANFSDMEMIAGQLINNGFDIAKNPDESNINLIVTCSVKDATEHRMIHQIKKLSKDNKPLVIAGCLPSADRKLAEKINPYASLMGPNSINKTIEIVKSTLMGEKSISIKNSFIEKINIPKIKINPVISIVEIGSGCLSECSFCQTKLAKGKIQSYRIGNIINQIKNDLNSGSKEIWLTSTDNGCYGLDINTNLVELLKKCIEMDDDNDYKIRVGMMNPMYLRNMIDDLLYLYTKNNKLFKFIHIPVQSGSERILRKMKRGHTAKTFKQIVRKFRERIPDITIATDIITGFPGETDEDFELTVKMLTELEPDIINSSKYSPRPGTEAANLKRIDQRIITKRSETLHAVTKNITKRRNSKWINWKGSILIDEIDNGKLKGRNQYYKSIILKEYNEKIVDALIKENNKLSNNELFKNNTAFHNMNLNDQNFNLFLGKTIDVKVVGYSNHTLEGIQIT